VVDGSIGSKENGDILTETGIQLTYGSVSYTNATDKLIFLKITQILKFDGNFVTFFCLYQES
jgi:hypothetical protein